MLQRKEEEKVKMDLAKCLKALNIEMIPAEKDLLRTDPKKWLESRRFRTQVLLNQGKEKTEAIYKEADGKNVQATFERIRREIQAIHWSGVCNNRPKTIIPVIDYSGSSANSNGKSGEIKFRTKKGGKSVDVLLKLSEAPPSAIFNKAPRKMCIRLEVFQKIPDELKFRTIFVHSLSSGEMFIDFITEKLWPVLEKADAAELAQKIKDQAKEEPEKTRNKSQEASGKSENSRLFAGNEPRQILQPVGLFKAAQHSSQVFGGGNGGTIGFGPPGFGSGSRDFSKFRRDKSSRRNRDDANSNPIPRVSHGPPPHRLTCSEGYGRRPRGYHGPYNMQELMSPHNPQNPQHQMNPPNQHHQNPQNPPPFTRGGSFGGHKSRGGSESQQWRQTGPGPHN